MPFLTLLRHGQSEWNKSNRFTGDVDVDLTSQGMKEARRAGELLKTIPIDCVFTSELKRSVDSASIAIHSRGESILPTESSSLLNERNYGDLQGLNKSDVAKTYGVEQVMLWRRSYSARPPNGESLEDTARRTLPYFKQRILGEIGRGKNVLVVAHGNSLRTIVMYLDKLTSDQVVLINIPTGIPLVYELSEEGKVLGKQYLRSPALPTLLAAQPTQT